MAEIYRAKLCGAEGFEKEVVIKKILPEWSSHKDFISMLVDEAKLAVLLTHSNIVQVFELGREGENCYIAMEYVPGVDLKKLWEHTTAEGKVLPLGISLYIMEQVLEGLAYAHSKKNSANESLRIIHRDISPQNILLSWDGNVKLTDFGIAKATLTRTETASGVHKGKFSYMSPEQANLESVGQATDLFSLGIIFYEMVTGRRLFGGGSDLQALDRIRRCEIDFRDTENQWPRGLKSILLKALQRRPEDRFPSALHFLKELEELSRNIGRPTGRKEFALFLEKSLSGKRTDIDFKKDQTVPLATPFNLVQTAKKFRPFFLGGVALLTFWLLSRHFMKTFPSLDETTLPSSPSTVSSGLPDTGHLSVLLLPWGQISVDDNLKKESPLNHLSLPVGNHRVTVFYEPKKIRETVEISLKGGGFIRCTANFGERPEPLTCR